MAECYRCGISDEREKLYDAVSNRGVVKICKICANEDGLPLVQDVDLTKPEKVKSVYERLSAMANLDPQRHKEILLEREREESSRKYRMDADRRQKTGLNLKSITDSNFEKSKPKSRTDLVNNFHWVIMRARRAKKLSQKQLAENIGEQESLIKNAEEGNILDNADVLVRKLEGYFGIRLRSGMGPYPTEDPARREARDKFEKEGTFDTATAEALRISDLQEIEKKKKADDSGGFFSFLKKKKKQEEAKPEEEKKELSDEEADEVLYGK